jgi:hypothetical protein
MTKIGARCLSVLVVWLAMTSAALAQGGTVQLAWDPNAESSVTGYIVSYGTASRAYTKTVDATNKTTASVTGLAEGQRYYFAVQAYTAAGVRSGYSSEITTVINSGVPADLLSPAAGSVISSSTQAFTWNTGTNVTGYWIDVGKTQGGYEIRSGYVGGAQSVSVSGIPLNGGPLWFRLRSLINGVYQIKDYQFSTQATSPSKVVSPVSGARLPDSSATVTWDAGVGVQFYWVNIGSTQGGYEYYSNYVGTARQLTVNGLPLDGRNIWVRLMSYIGGQYQSLDYRFVAAVPGPAQIDAPTVEATIGSPAQAFWWSKGVGATAYWVNVGSAQGGYDFYSNYVGGSRGLTVTGLPMDGRDIWVRLMSFINGQWQFVDHHYRAPTPRPGRITSPTAGTALSGSSQTFVWDSGVNVSFYWVNVGSTQGGYEYYSNYVGKYNQLTVSGLPVDGRPIWVRLMSYINGAYVSVDHQFRAPTPGPARIIDPSVGARLSTSSTLTLQWDEGVAVSGYWLDIGTSQGGYDVYSNYVGTVHSAIIPNVPLGGDIWVRLYSRIGDRWEITEYKYATAPQ